MFIQPLLNCRRLFILQNWPITNYKIYKNRLTIKPIIKKTNHKWGEKVLFFFIYRI